jgi:hypothetical protein
MITFRNLKQNMSGEGIHNQYESDRAFVLTEASNLLSQWKELPHDHLSDSDYALGISLERQRNKYRHAWFDAIGELVGIMEDQGLGLIAERNKIKNISMALNYQVAKHRESTPHEYIEIGDQLLRRIVNMLL